MSEDWYYGQSPCPDCGHYCADHAACSPEPGGDGPVVECFCSHPCHLSDSVTCPACGGTAMIALCGKPVNGSGSCVLGGEHTGPCWGEEDVASDWEPAAQCRTCCVCACGTHHQDETPCRFCGDVVTPGRVPR